MEDSDVILPQWKYYLKSKFLFVFCVQHNQKPIMKLRGLQIPHESNKSWSTYYVEYRHVQFQRLWCKTTPSTQQCDICTTIKNPTHVAAEIFCIVGRLPSSLRNGWVFRWSALTPVHHRKTCRRNADHEFAKLIQYNGISHGGFGYTCQSSIFICSGRPEHVVLMPCKYICTCILFIFQFSQRWCKPVSLAIWR